MKKKDQKLLSDVLMDGAAVSVAFSAIGYLETDIWLDSTQWLFGSLGFCAFGGLL